MANLLVRLKADTTYVPPQVRPVARPRAPDRIRSVRLSRTPGSRLKHANQLAHRIVELVDDALLERNDGVIGDGDALRADLRAALGDVAVSDPMGLLQIGDPVFRVDRVHLERRRIDHVTRTGKLVEELMIPENVTDVLTEEAFDALPEFLHALDVHLLHAPGAVGRVRRARLEARDGLLRAEVPRDVRHQVLDGREGAHRLDRHGLGDVDL